MKFAYLKFAIPENKDFLKIYIEKIVLSLKNKICVIT